MVQQYDLFAVWFRVADWGAYDLMKDGCESILLKPLGECSSAATLIARSGSQSVNYRHRKLVSSLAGWIQEPPLDLLNELFQHEVERNRQLSVQDSRRLDQQSVVEDIVFSASRWARNPMTRDAAIEVLRVVVEQTIAGEYWNTSGYAITTLSRYEAEGHTELLKQFVAFANGEPIDHVSRPSYAQERLFAANLLVRNPDTLNAIEHHLDAQDEVAKSFTLDEKSRSAINELVDFARRVDAFPETDG